MAPPPGRRVLLLGLAALPACGYSTEPVARGPVARPSRLGLAPGGAAPRPAVQLLVSAREEREAQLLREYLDIALQRADVSDRVAGVAVRLELTTQELAIRRDETPSRARITATAQYVATPVAAAPGVEPPPVRGLVRVLDGYNFVDQEFFATDTSRDAAVRRMLEEAAGQIARRLQLVPPPAAPPASAPASAARG